MKFLSLAFLSLAAVASGNDGGHADIGLDAESPRSSPSSTSLLRTADKTADAVAEKEALRDDSIPVV